MVIPIQRERVRFPSSADMPGELYGSGGDVQRTIREAWSGVGLHVPVSLTRSGGARGKLTLPAA